MNPPRSKTRRRINALSVAKMIVAMQSGPLTVHELREISGLSLFTTRSYVLTLHREGGCRVAMWEPDARGRHVTAAYVMGPGADAPKPKTTPAERSKQYRARVRQIGTLRAIAGGMNHGQTLASRGFKA